MTLGALFARLGHLPNRPNGVVSRPDGAKGRDRSRVHVTEWSSRVKSRPKSPENGSNVQLDMCSRGSFIAEPGSRCQKSNHKLARIIYAMLKNQTEYVAPSEDAYEEQARQRALGRLKRKAKTLGFQIIPVSS